MIESARRRRRRVVLVGRPPVEVGDAMRPIAADDLSDAVGVLGTAGVREPVTAMVMPAALLAGRDEAVRAIRLLDPTVRLVGIGEPDPAAAFDCVLPVGADALSLESACEDASLSSARPSAAPPVQADAAAAGPTAPEDTAVRPEAEKAERPHEAASVLEADDHPPARDADAPRGVVPPRAPESLGDVDLVEAVLAGDGRLEALAIEIARRHSGLDDLHLADDPAPGDASVPIDGDRRRLASTAASDGDVLAPWAAWLARWLALDRHHRELSRMAWRDDLTGAWNRRYFRHFLDRVLVEARRRRRPVTVMVFDLDDFKQYNDRYGDTAGDEILVETVRMLQSVVRSCDRVCRIGGDEFAVVFADLEPPRTAGSTPPESVETIAARFRSEVCRMRFPKLGPDAPGPLSISAGLATLPWDGLDATTLLRLADERALASKRRGKNCVTFGACRPSGPVAGRGRTTSEPAPRDGGMPDRDA